MKKCFMLACLLLLFGGAQAEGWYRWVDKSGNVHYSDSLPVDAVEVVKQGIGVAPPTSDVDLPYETRRAQQNFPVTLYVIESCGEPCQIARNLLNERGVPFSEASLKTQEEFDAFKKISGSAGVPALAVGKIWLKNFLAKEWHSELDIAGYPKNAPYRLPAPAKPASQVEKVPTTSP